MAIRALILCLLICARATGADAGAAVPEPKPLLAAPQTVASGAEFAVTVQFQLEPGVKLYRDKLEFTWTKLDGATYVELDLPPGKRVPDPLADDPAATLEVYERNVEISAQLIATAKPGDQITITGNLHHESCTEDFCFPPADEAFEFSIAAAEPAPAQNESNGLFHLLLQLLGVFGAGVVISLTPCVYPLIPITAAVVGARRERGILSSLVASLLYVLGLSLVYAVLGLVIAKVGSAAASFLQTPAVLVPVALIFVLLAAVMFKGISFTPGAGAAGRMQSWLAGKRGLFSIFALGAVSGLVASPCVAAPVAGLLIYVAQTGDMVFGFFALMALAWGMGIPLVIFGTASGMLPKAGPWMESVKRLIGFVLLWAAIYFIRPVIGDVAYQLAFAALLVSAAVFLKAFDALAAGSSFLERLRAVAGWLAVLAAVALVVSALGQVAAPAKIEAVENIFAPATPNDVDAAIASGEPVVLDFHAEWCTICKELDKKVFTTPEAASAARGIATLKIDIDEFPALAKEYNVFRPPVVVFISRAGSVQEDLSFAGKISRDEFVRRLEALKTR